MHPPGVIIEHRSVVSGQGEVAGQNRPEVDQTLAIHCAAMTVLLPIQYISFSA